MAETPDTPDREPDGQGRESAGPESTEREDGERGSRGRGRLAVLGTIAGVVLLVGGFFIGRASEGEGSDTPATTTTDSAATDSGGKAPRVLTRACSKNAGPDAEDVVKAFPPIIVTDGAIEEQGKGSPGAALLEWWQAYQFDDLNAVEALTSQATIDELGEDNLAALVQLSGPGLQGIEILDVSESGNTATVNAGLLSFQPEEPGGPVPDEPSNTLPETFAMEKEGGEWRFAQTDFLTLKLNSLPEDV
jgi:hypothetical protein